MSEPEEQASDGLSAGLLMGLIVAVLGGVAMVAMVFPGLLVLVPVGIGIAALLGVQLVVYRLFGLKASGPSDPRRPPGGGD